MTASTRNWPRSPAASGRGWQRRRRSGIGSAGAGGWAARRYLLRPLRCADYEGARASAGTGLYPPVMRGLLGRGVAIAPGPYEVFFPSLAHGDTDLERTLAAFSEVARRSLAS